MSKQRSSAIVSARGGLAGDAQPHVQSDGRGGSKQKRVVNPELLTAKGHNRTAQKHDDCFARYLRITSSQRGSQLSGRTTNVLSQQEMDENGHQQGDHQLMQKRNQRQRDGQILRQKCGTVNEERRMDEKRVVVVLLR